MTTVVEAIDLKKTYIIGKVSVKALRGINLKVDRGDQRQEQEYAPSPQSLKAWVLRYRLF